MDVFQVKTWPKVTRNVAKIAKTSTLLHKTDAAEKDGSVRFRTRNRNTATSVYAQHKNGKKARKWISIKEISTSFGKLGSPNWMLASEFWLELTNSHVSISNTCSKNMVKNVAKLWRFLYNINTAENNGDSRFQTYSENTTISVQRQNGLKHQKMYLDL